MFRVCSKNPCLIARTAMRTLVANQWAPDLPALSDLQSQIAAERYVSASGLAHRREFGQFFTPSSVARLMADWVVTRDEQRILDPAMGVGVLTEACLEKNPTTEVTAFEKDAQVVQFAPHRVLDHVHLTLGDFLQTETAPKFDGFIMNPPYIRHREIEGYDRERLDISSRAGCVIPKSANLYIYFSVKAVSALKSGGRGAILIPSEWMSANFSTGFKKFLLKRNLLRQLVVFSHCSSVFDDALTTASVLFVERQDD